MDSGNRQYLYYMLDSFRKLDVSSVEAGSKKEAKKLLKEKKIKYCGIWSENEDSFPSGIEPLTVHPRFRLKKNNGDEIVYSGISASNIWALIICLCLGSPFIIWPQNSAFSFYTSILLSLALIATGVAMFLSTVEMTIDRNAKTITEKLQFLFYTVKIQTASVDGFNKVALKKQTVKISGTNNEYYFVYLENDSDSILVDMCGNYKFELDLSTGIAKLFNIQLFDMTGE